MANNIVLHASQSRVSVDNWDIKTGEYNIQDCSVVFEEDLKEALTDQYKWFAVFKYDKREYESEIDLDVNSENKPFDMPVFSKPGYVNVGVYGYEYAIGTINKEQVAEKVAGINTYTGHPVNWCYTDFDLTDDFKATYGEFIDTDTVKFDTFTNKYTLAFKTIIVGGAERELPAGTKITVTYKYRSINPETGDPIMRLRYSPSMQLCEVKNGSSPVQPIPSPGTYAKLNQRIDELGEGIHDTETMRNWWHNFTQNQEVLNLREVFNTMTESGSYVASYKNIYDIIEDYFGEGKEKFPKGEKKEKILDKYYIIKLTEVEGVWSSDKTYAEIKNAIDAENKIPVITYGTTPDTHFAIYQNIKDDAIVFVESLIRQQSTQPDLKELDFIEFSICETTEKQTYVIRENITISQIDGSGYEVKSNKAQTINAQSPSDKLYPSEAAVVSFVGKDGLEKTSNKAQQIDSTQTGEGTLYTSVKSVVNYAQDKSKKTNSISSTSTQDEYPSAKAVYDYSEDKSLKKTDFITVNDVYYPTIQAVVNYVSKTSAVKFNRGLLSKDGYGTGELVSDPVTETVITIPAHTMGRFNVKLSRESIYTGDPLPTGAHYPSIVPQTSGVAIDETSTFVDGVFSITVTKDFGETTPINVEYYYYNIQYKWQIHFYNNNVEADISPIDVTQLRSGGGGFGTAFDKVTLREANGEQKLVFYYNDQSIGIQDGSLAKIQLASAATDETSEKGATHVKLMSKCDGEAALAEFDLDSPLTEQQMIELKKLI